MAAKRHHTLPWSRPLDTSAGHKHLPYEYPTAHVSTTLTGQVPHDYGRLYMLDHGRISGFFLLLYFTEALSYYLYADRSLLDEHLPTYSCVGMSVLSRALQVKLLVLSRLPATNEQGISCAHRSAPISGEFCLYNYLCRHCRCSMISNWIGVIWRLC